MVCFTLANSDPSCQQNNLFSLEPYPPYSFHMWLEGDLPSFLLEIVFLKNFFFSALLVKPIHKNPYLVTCLV